jgi:hypothetical protein
MIGLLTKPIDLGTLVGAPKIKATAASLNFYRFIVSARSQAEAQNDKIPTKNGLVFQTQASNRDLDQMTTVNPDFVPFKCRS